METRIRNSLIAILVLALLVAGIAALVKFGKLGQNASDQPLPTARPYLLVGESSQQVTGVDVIDNATGNTLSASTEDGTTWTVSQWPEGVEPDSVVDSSRIGQAVGFFPTLQPTRTLTGINDVTPYGLDSPSYTVRIHLSNGGVHELSVGNLNPTSTGYYAQLSEIESPATTVFLISKATLDSVLQMIDTPPLIAPSPTPEATPTGEGTVEPTGTPDTTGGG